MVTTTEIRIYLLLVMNIVNFVFSVEEQRTKKLNCI
jgi:hypothetical protein